MLYIGTFLQHCIAISILQPVQSHTHIVSFAFTKQKGCQVFDSYVCSLSYALLTITELSNDELSNIHTLSLPPLLL